MAVNDDLLARMVGHQIGLYRLSTGIVRRILKLLDAVDGDILAAIRDRDPGEVTSGHRQRRINALLTDLRRINQGVYRVLQQRLQDELRGVVRYEPEYQLGMLNDVLPVRLNWRTPSAEQLIALVAESPFQGYLLKEWVAGLERGRRDRLTAAVRIGYAEGETVDQMVRRVRGTSAASFKDGVLEISRRSVDAMVRTAVNHVSTQARELFYERNDDLVEKVRWVSTLDLRTTAICRGRDGKIYPVGEGPRPPAHIRCRSTTAPVVKSWRELGIDLDEAPEGTRASMNGQVPAAITYGEWLRGRSAAEQDEVLGAKAGRLFRAGGLSMEKFADSTGRAYTLEELKRRESAAWKRAGLAA